MNTIAIAELSHHPNIRMLFFVVVAETVSIITNDSRVLVGVLRGTDQVTNVILDSCHERSFTPQGVEITPLGLYIVRGDNMCVFYFQMQK